ncbi:manganese-dependent inorganic pyrophosphatase [Candidatus Enterococcus clewellii]|uniref:Probable manganese-dependent inorganic pyrophosphatase n=1 Tax=Candidatus Enterococcus clewellii TaxID=1834193 RepID=A0A242KBU5_9ENTE|nr:manganese-dependent inorganic pyrophosphatase [Enterococcus sp. 9E7_DIV0242]OTP18644.1 manganese-dependent inorganic pyrophosphatase [Enterococcus sp. 9E7_DIV0242]
MSEIFVFGHQNPDTDAIGAAISFAYLQKELGKNTVPVALGTPSEETQYALDYFNVPAPRVIEEAGSQTKQVMLVDHNEFQQSVADIKDLSILAVVDHHRIANFETADPLYYRAEPVGCTSTIIFKMFKESNVVIPTQIAGMMVSAIISDTLLFKSPTCTEEDIQAANELAAIAEIDLNGYGLDMLKAGTNLSDKSAEVLLDLDAKSFPLGDKNVRIAQINTVDFNDILSRQDELEATMNAEITANGYEMFILIITNILDSDSELLVLGNSLDKVEKAFNISLENNRSFLKGVVSRKKQIVPQLTEAFN